MPQTARMRYDSVANVSTCSASGTRHASANAPDAATPAIPDAACRRLPARRAEAYAHHET